MKVKFLAGLGIFLSSFSHAATSASATPTASPTSKITAQNYLEVAFSRYQADMMGYILKSDGSVDWSARAAVLKGPTLNITRPGSGRAGQSTCLQTDYSYWNYFLDMYLMLSPDEKSRFWQVTENLFYSQLSGSEHYSVWRNYQADQWALLTALNLQDPGVMPSNTQADLAKRYQSGNKVLTTNVGNSISLDTAFERFVSANEAQSSEMQRFQFWKAMTQWAVPYGLKNIYNEMVLGNPNQNGEPSLPVKDNLKLRTQYYLTVPQFKVTAGNPTPIGTFLIDLVDERSPTSPIATFFNSLPDGNSPYAGTVFMNADTRAANVQKWIQFLIQPSQLWRFYYVWARTGQANAFFDWLYFTYDPNNPKYGGCSAGELCWSGHDLFSAPNVTTNTSCVNTILKGKPQYASEPSAYTYSFVDSPNAAAANLTTLVNCYCSD